MIFFSSRLDLCIEITLSVNTPGTGAPPTPDWCERFACFIYIKYFIDTLSSMTEEWRAVNFIPTGKGRALALHPSLPWLLAADVADDVVLWDWEARAL